MSPLSYKVYEKYAPPARVQRSTMECLRQVTPGIEPATDYRDSTLCKNYLWGGTDHSVPLENGI